MIDKHGRNALLTVGLIVVLFTAGCSYINAKMGLPDDHPAEQMAEIVIESVIKHNTGASVDIDLSEDSDDNPDKIYPDAED